MGMRVGLVASRTTVVELRRAFTETFEHLEEVDSSAFASADDLRRWLEAHRPRIGGRMAARPLPLQHAPDDLTVAVAERASYTFVRTEPVMRKKLSAIGNSLGIVIEKPILELLDISRDTELEMTTEGGKLIIAPIRRARRARVKEAMDEVMADHAGTFRKLAR